MKFTQCEFLHSSQIDKDSIVAFFRRVFGESEGSEEGASIGGLVSHLLIQTSSENVLGYVARQDNRLVGCVLYSRFTLPSEKVAFILSPMAVAPEFQGLGIGQQLIRESLGLLRTHCIELVFTYGDPAFYSTVGFEHIGEDVIPSPYPLTQPMGWLARVIQFQL